MTAAAPKRTLLSDLKALAAYEPAVAAWAASGGLAVAAAWTLDLTSVQEAAVTTITTALAVAWTAWQARPVPVPAMTGALVTAVTAASAFGFHPPAHVIAAGAGVLSAVLALAFRANLTPAATIRTAAARAGGAKQKRGTGGG